MYSMEKLKQKRTENKLKQKDMAEKLNITTSFYSQLESKKKKLYYVMAIKIAAIFNMKPDQLFYTEKR